MDKKEKIFDTMKWIRSVRDEMFDKYYKGDLGEYLKAISTPAKKTEDKLSQRDPIPHSKVEKKNSKQRIKSFDAVKWVREIRDKIYEENKHLSSDEYLKKISHQHLDEMTVKENQKKYSKKN